MPPIASAAAAVAKRARWALRIPRSCAPYLSGWSDSPRYTCGATAVATNGAYLAERPRAYVRPMAARQPRAPYEDVGLRLINNLAKAHVRITDGAADRCSVSLVPSSCRDKSTPSNQLQKSSVDLIDARKMRGGRYPR